ncbi:MAG: hypothetical protein HS111_12040 [Kofleriaceae bacterium]|nr:hypothetical protein [Kofleriaceae bacterium]MCL4227495.1 hypothetical protein [Myxococcales bacterium]
MRSFLLVLAGTLALAAAIAAVRGRALGELEVTAASATPAASTRLPAAGEVASVRVAGPGLPIATLERALSTRVGAPLTDADLARDRAALVATLEARGHLGAAVDDVRVTWAGGAHVVFEVSAGHVYLVDEVRVTGVPARLAASAAGVPTLLRGQPWQPGRAADNVALLRDWLARRGVAAEVTARRELDHARHTVEVTFEVRALAPTARARRR